MAAPPPHDDPSNVEDMIQMSPPVDCSKPYDTSTLAGKAILITGGASGFGAAFARHWARHGSHIFIGDVNDDAGEALIAELRSSSLSTPDQRFHYQHCDVTSWADQVSLFRAAVASSPTRGIDAVVAAAGIVERGDTLKLSPSSSNSVFDNPASTVDPNTPPPLRVLAVNLTGVMYTAHLALFHLPLNSPDPAPAANNPPHAHQGDRDRHLLLISSVAGLFPLPGQTEYTTSKHAVMGLFRALRATTWQARHVRVNLLAPYFVDTPLLPRTALALLAGAAMGRVEDVVDAATRLVADEGVRGRALVVGPRIRNGEGGGLSFADVDVDGDGDVEVDGGGLKGEGAQAVWELYGHDYARVEMFVWRYLAVLNWMRKVRGWVGLVKDFWGIYVARNGRG